MTSTKTNTKRSKLGCLNCKHITEFGPHIPIVGNNMGAMLPMKVKHVNGKIPCVGCSHNEQRQAIIASYEKHMQLTKVA